MIQPLPRREGGNCGTGFGRKTTWPPPLPGRAKPGPGSPAARRPRWPPGRHDSAPSPERRGQLRHGVRAKDHLAAATPRPCKTRARQPRCQEKLFPPCRPGRTAGISQKPGGPFYAHGTPSPRATGAAARLRRPHRMAGAGGFSAPGLGPPEPQGMAGRTSPAALAPRTEPERLWIRVPVETAPRRGPFYGAGAHPHPNRLRRRPGLRTLAPPGAQTRGSRETPAGPRGSPAGGGPSLPLPGKAACSRRGSGPGRRPRPSPAAKTLRRVL
jgi:hypothetical protein